MMKHNAQSDRHPLEDSTGQIKEECPPVPGAFGKGKVNQGMWLNGATLETFPMVSTMGSLGHTWNMLWVGLSCLWNQQKSEANLLKVTSGQNPCERHICTELCNANFCKHLDSPSLGIAALAWSWLHPCCAMHWVTAPCGCSMQRKEGWCSCTGSLALSLLFHIAPAHLSVLCTIWVLTVSVTCQGTHLPLDGYNLWI